MWEAWEASERHLRGIWETSTLGFPLLPETWTRKDMKAQVSWITDILRRFATFLLTFHRTLQWKPTEWSMILELYVFDLFDPSWPTKNLFCDTSGTAAGHYYRFGAHILLPWTPNGNLFGLPWAPCAGQFDPPGPMLENYWKRNKRTFFYIHFWNPFVEGGTCNPFTPVQSKHTFHTYLWHLFLSLKNSKRSKRCRNPVEASSTHPR